MKLGPAEAKTYQRYVQRSVGDAGFAHFLMLAASAITWAKTIPVGHKIDFNDINMIQIPAEALEALIRHHARIENNSGELHQKATAALEFLEQFERTMLGKDQKP